MVLTAQPSPAPPDAGPAPAGLRRLSFKALGTRCEVQYVADAAETATSFERAAVAWVGAFEAKYSRFRPDSLLSRINAAAGREWVAVDAEMEQMLDFCGALHAMTGGLVDATALPLMRLWDYHREHPTVPAPSAIDAARRLVGWPKVRRAPGRVFLPEPGMALDFGGFGKEYAVDAVAQIALAHGIGNVLVDFGHDLRALGAPPGRPCWHIGLENPAAPGSVWGSIGVTGQGVASSGDYLRGFTAGGRRYGHILDPRTGRPVAHRCTSATAIAGSCLQAGVLSTCAFILGPVEGLRFIESVPGADGCVLTDRERAQTRNFYTHVVSS